MAKLIIIGGSLATGKTTLARLLEDHTGIKRISMDELKERLFDLGGYRDRKWSKQIGQLAWPVFREMVEMHLARGEDVIAEATFLWPDDYKWIESICERYGAVLFQIWLTADPRVARQRFIDRSTSSERHPGHCDSLESVIDEFDERFFSKTFIPLPIDAPTHIIDTTDFAQADFNSVFKLLDH
jgi:predicted kinase